MLFFDGAGDLFGDLSRNLCGYLRCHLSGNLLRERCQKLLHGRIRHIDAVGIRVGHGEEPDRVNGVLSGMPYYTALPYVTD